MPREHKDLRARIEKDFKLLRYENKGTIFKFSRLVGIEGSWIAVELTDSGKKRIMTSDGHEGKLKPVSMILHLKRIDGDKYRQLARDLSVTPKDIRRINEVSRYKAPPGSGVLPHHANTARPDDPNSIQDRPLPDPTDWDTILPGEGGS